MIKDKWAVLYSLSALGISFCVSIGSVITYYQAKYELADKYNKTLDQKLSKIMTVKQSEESKKFEEIQSTIKVVQENILVRLKDIESRVEHLDKK